MITFEWPIIPASSYNAKKSVRQRHKLIAKVEEQHFQYDVPTY